MRPLLAEALRDIVSRRVQVGLFVFIAFVASAFTVAIYGSSVASADAALQTLETPSARTVVVRIDPTLGVHANEVEPLLRLEPLEAAVVLGSARSAYPAGLPDAPAMAIRTCLAAAGASSCPPVALAASGVALDVTIRTFNTGATSALVVDDSRNGYYVTPSVAPILEAPALADTVIVSPSQQRPVPIALVLLVADSSQHVSTIASAAAAGLSGWDSEKISVESSPEIGALRNDISDATRSGAKFTATGILVAMALVLGLAELSAARGRRQILALRRALGASQGQVIALAVSGTALTVLVGATAGALVTSVWLPAAPGWRFTSATVMLVVGAAALAALLPAAYGATRDPARELRVP